MTIVDIKPPIFIFKDIASFEHYKPSWDKVIFDIIEKAKQVFLIFKIILIGIIVNGKYF